MGSQYGYGEVKRSFDEEWDVEWEAAGDGSAGGEQTPWWESTGELQEHSDNNERPAIGIESIAEEALPCALEEVLKASDKRFVDHLRRAEAFVKGVAVYRKNHFELIQGRRARAKIFKTQHGQEFLNLIKGGCDSRCHQMLVVDQNPFVGIYHKVVRKWNSELKSMARYDVLKGGLQQTVDTLNEIVDEMRGEVDKHSVKLFAQRIDRSTKERGRRAVSIIDKCFVQRSRLLVLRVDLGYRKGRFIDSQDLSNDLEKVKQHWVLLSKGLRKGLVVPNFMAAFGKIEYGVLSGFHIHMIVVMKGAEHQEDISYAKRVGEYWCQNAVGEEGRYFNCNRIKNRYQKIGIGEVNYYEAEKIDTLKKVVIGYVVKSDYYMGALSPSRKTFLQLSCIKPNSDDGRGRPRRYAAQA